MKFTVKKCRNAQVMFRAGKNQDGSKDLLLQVDKAINVSKDVHHLRLVYFFLTMLLATRSKPKMPFQLTNYQKASMQYGANTKVVQECGTQHSNLETKLSHKSCISQMTTQWCQDGSRAWKSSSRSGGCGQKRGSMLNVRIQMCCQEDQLLLPLPPFPATWFRYTEITPWRTDHFAWSHL